MWGSINNIIEYQSQQKIYKKHIHNLKTVKSTLYKSCPKYSHPPNLLWTKPKPNKQYLTEREQQIQFKNRMLLDKLMQLKSSFKDINKQRYLVNGLNDATKKHKNQEIYRSNSSFFKKLQGIRSKYETSKILLQTNKHRQYSINISKNASRTLEMKLFSVRNSKKLVTLPSKQSNTLVSKQQNQLTRPESKS